MTRINTNVPSLVAQNRLRSSNSDLQQALTRLSTGLRINSGADDPAGLIASEALRSEITSLGKAISNTRRASQIISTADSALGQVSNLLNDVRGLVVEAANQGALSDDEVAANQLQVDSSLEAINRIAQTTTFQGRKLLDGGLDFLTTAGQNFGNINNLEIEQANLGAIGSLNVSVSITEAASQASITIPSIPVAVPTEKATGTLDLTRAVVAAPAAGQLEFTEGTSTATIAVTASANGEAFNKNIIFDESTPGATFGASIDGNGDIVVTIDPDTDQSLASIAAAIDGLTDYGAVLTNTDAPPVGDYDGGTSTPPTITALTGGTDAGTLAAEISLTSKADHAAANGSTITFQTTATVGPPVAAVDANGNVTVTVQENIDIDVADIVSAITAEGTYDAELTAGNTLTQYNSGTDGNSPTAFAGGVTASGGLAEDVVFELLGKTGSEVFNVSAGTGINDLLTQINLVSDATGVTAEARGQDLVLTSTAYGSDAVVDLRVIKEADGGTIKSSPIGPGKRDQGSDIKAKVNGIDANGKGNTLSINTSTLDLSITVAAGSSDSVGFQISGGGALFQLGSDVVSNQQARIGIGSVSSTRLGGTAGRLFELGSGEAAALSKDPNLAAKIVTEAINQVTGIRGRLGAFQATTLDSNIVSLQDTVANLQEAESSIRDADFAQESANLTRAQILVQSGTNVLSLANQNPQSVLSLLR